MADDIKMRLIDVAGKNFAERGYDAVGIREICHEAGANVAAINYHFGDKYALYRACIQHAQSCHIGALAHPQWPVGLSPEEKLRTFIRTMLETKLDRSRPPWHQDLMLRELSRPSECCREIVESYIRPMAQTLGDILIELLPERPWDGRMWLIGCSIVAQVMFHQVQQPAIELLLGAEHASMLTLDALTDHITRFSLAALGRGPAVAS